MSEKHQIEYNHIAVEGVFKSGKTRLAGLLSQRLGGKVVLDKTGQSLPQGLLRRKGRRRLPGPARLPGQPLSPAGPARPAGPVRRADLLRLHLRKGQDLTPFRRCPTTNWSSTRRSSACFAERIPKPDLVIYLQISVPTLIRRLAKEGSPLEKNISEKYLQDLVEALRLFLLQLSGDAAARHQVRRRGLGPGGGPRRHHRADPADEEDVLVLRPAELRRTRTRGSGNG